MNNNLQAQSTSAPPSNSSPPTLSAINNKSQTQQPQRPTNEQATVSSHRGRFGKSKGRFRGGRTSVRLGLSNPIGSIGETATQDCLDNQNVPNPPRNVSTPSRSTTHRTGGPNRGGSGKYRQRQQTNQLIEGMEGLDLDLIESIAPTDTDKKRSEAGGRSKHPTNSRKVNLTHLLNYGYDRKQHGGRRRNTSLGDNSSNAGSFSRPAYAYRDSGATHKFNKQQFLQANCQFVVIDGYDYSIHKVDPDWPVEWDCIEEVKFKQIASTETTCPICLEPSIAAKITRCGHIYCWTCMLHYLSLSDENHRQCPICFEPVYKSDLRSVVSRSYPNHAIGEEIVMKLMVRRKGCVEVEPFWKEFSQAREGDGPGQSSDQLPREHYNSRANLIIVDPKTVIRNVVEREKEELLIKLEIDRDEPEVCFIEQALEGCGKRILRLRKIETNRPQVKNQASAANTEQSHSAVNEPTRSYFFYQSSDGQHIYLNPFSTKILCHQYNSLENCPLEIRAKVLQMDWVSMSEGWRKRFKYLEHLPLTCEFRLIEIDFEKSELVSQETYMTYLEQIKSRAQEREKRRREERKREKIIQVEQNRKIYGIQSTLKINLDNTEQFPSVSDERYLGLAKVPNAIRDSDTDQMSDDSDVVPGTVNTEEESTAQPRSTAAILDVVESQINDSGHETRGALSFRDIQLQEASLAAAKELEAKQGVWGSKQKPTTNAHSAGAQAQSSFAQLLFDAKTSQKEWTRNLNHQQTPLPSTLAATAHTGAQSGHRSSAAPLSSAASDDGGEELRAPPSEFTISDFIDMNIVSGRRGRGKSSKNLSKKG